jgi:hypothetical protein
LTQNQTNSLQETSEISVTTSLILAFTLMQDCISVQFGQVDTLDAKANSAQVSASALVGAALVLQASLLGLNSTILHRVLQILALLPLLIIYACVIYFASKGYRVRDYKRVPTPGTLLKNLHMTEIQMKTAMLDAMGEAFKINEQKIKNKVRYIDRANLALKIETGALIVVLLVQTALPLFLR